MGNRASGKTTHDKIDIKVSCYPEVICGKAYHDHKWKYISRVQVYECPLIFLSPSCNKCSHTIYIYFTDGTVISGGPKLELNDMQKLGYIPFIKQYRPDNETQYIRQLNTCSVSKLIGADNIHKFGYDVVS